MITLRIQVPAAREHCALATLDSGSKKRLTAPAAASATATIAAARGNPACDPLRVWGHPPTGTYQLLSHRAANKGEAAEYGAHLFCFEPQSGQARSAEAHGRLGLLVYGGPPDRDQRLRRTQGGVRLTDVMLSAITKQLGRGREMTLVIDILRPPPWWQLWQFWKRAVTPPPLSATTPDAIAPPLDELSITQELMRGVKRRRAYTSDERERPDDRRSSDDSNSSRNTGRGEREVFQGGGGQSGGGGASGSWDGPRGVDASGRMLTGTVAGMGAAVAYDALSADDTRTTTSTSY